MVVLMFSRNRTARVRFEAQDGNFDYSSLLEVASICVSLAPHPQGRRDCLTFVLDETRKLWAFESGQREPKIEIDQECISLEKILSLTPNSLSESTRMYKRDRLLLAVNLASSLLQLHETPWLPVNWCNKSIYFSRPIKLEKPYVLAKFSDSQTSQEAAQKSVVLNPYLVELGIMLLELSEGKSFLEWLNSRSDPNSPIVLYLKRWLLWNGSARYART